MKNIQIIELTEDEHGFFGIGKIIYQYSNGKQTQLKISLPDIKAGITHTGNKAKELFFKALAEDDIAIICHIKKLASDACFVPVFRLKEKSRSERIVFARQLVYWYVMHVLEYRDKNGIVRNYSDTKAGRMFGQDRTTALHGKNCILLGKKYMKEVQQVMLINFINKLKEFNLLPTKYENEILCKK